MSFNGYRLYTLGLDGDEKGSLSIHFDSKDAIDANIIKAIAMLPANLNVSNMIFKDEKKPHDIYYGNVLGIAENLLKANSARRDYTRKEKFLADQFISRHKNYLSENKNNSADFQENPVELKTYIDSFLSYFKTSLDLLAKSFNPLYNFSLNGWRRKGNIAGGRFIEAIKKNFSEKDQKKEVHKVLVEMLEKNINWMNYLIFELRDKVQHGGGLNNITNFKYNFLTQKLEMPQIIHPDKSRELVVAFLDRTIVEMYSFVNMVMIYALQIKLPLNIIYDGEMYRWGIPTPPSNKTK